MERTAVEVPAAVRERREGVCVVVALAVAARVDPSRVENMEVSMGPCVNAVSCTGALR